MNREGSKRHWKLYPLRIAGYVLLFVVMVVLYFFFKSYVVASLVWLLVLLPVVSIWLNWKMTPYLTVRISALQPKVIAGEESRFMCKLSNAFPWVSLQCELRERLAILCITQRIRSDCVYRYACVGKKPWSYRLDANIVAICSFVSIRSPSRICSVLYRCSRKFLRRRRSR